MENGYCSITTRCGKKRSELVHRLILLTFIGESDLQCNHKNGIKTDNRLENIEYCTCSENHKHAYSIGLRKAPVGEASCRSKLTEEQVKEIKLLGGKVRPYGYWTNLARELNINPATIYLIREGKNWRYLNG